MQSLSAQTTGTMQEMRNILSNGDLFDGFMTHLLHEYCSEALLSVIEFIQFKDRIRMENADRFEDHGMVQIILPDSVPDSAIVHGERGLDYKSMAMELVDKYISVGSDFQINISHDVREGYTQDAIDGLDIVELERLFDPAIHHMIGLIRAAFRRFIKSDTFALIACYSPPPMSPSENDTRHEFAFNV